MAFNASDLRNILSLTRKLAPVLVNYILDRRKLLKNEVKETDKPRFERHAQKMLKTFIELGPTFIKFGQVLSTRPDVLPQEYINELSKLQDEVPPAPFEEIRKQIDEDLGPVEQVFDSFNPEAISGASLGQVHRAVLNGVEVAVKVNRPRIRERVAADLRVLKKLFPLFRRFIDESLAFSVASILEEFSITIFQEMDYKLEAENLLRIKANLKHDKRVIIPNVFLQYTSHRVLTMEYISGIKITDVDAIRKQGLDPKNLASKVNRTFLKMLLTHDIFHADPHPGNIAVKEDGSIVLYDFGMVGSLDQKTRKKLIRLYLAMADRNPEKIMGMLIKLGTLQPTANPEVIKRAIELAIVNLEGRKVEEMEVKELLEIANRTIYQFPFRLPRYLVLYMRMTTILEGVCRALHPNFNFIKTLGSLLDEEGLRREAIIEDYYDLFNRIGQALEATIDVAPMLKSFLEYSYQRGLPPRASSSSPSLLAGVIGVGLLAVSYLLYLEQPLYGQIGFILAVLAIFFAVARRGK